MIIFKQLSKFQSGVLQDTRHFGCFIKNSSPTLILFSSIIEHPQQHKGGRGKGVPSSLLVGRDVIDVFYSPNLQEGF